MKFRTFFDLNHAISYGLYRIPRDIDLIVGIPRSGMMVASIISLYLNLPLTDLDAFCTKKGIYSCGNTKRRDDWIFDLNKVHKILLVDDSASSGKSAVEALEKIKQSTNSVDVCFLICYVTPTTKDIPDIYLEEIDSPRMFEWNYLHHTHLKFICFDLDGVLCLNPTREQDDDGEEYLNFLKHAALRVAPSREIGYIVTSRLEKYRKQTEEWLSNNGIKYKHLIMMNFNTKEEKTLANINGIFKGEFFKGLTDSYLFIESDPVQASQIAAISQKMVFCTSNHKVYEGNKETD